MPHCGRSPTMPLTRNVRLRRRRATPDYAALRAEPDHAALRAEPDHAALRAEPDHAADGPLSREHDPLGVKTHLSTVASLHKLVSSGSHESRKQFAHGR